VAVLLAGLAFEFDDEIDVGFGVVAPCSILPIENKLF
jgi:hypothetical protein